MYVCLRIWVFVYIYMHVFYVLLQRGVCMDFCMYINVDVFMYACVYIFVYVYMYMSVYVCLCVCVLCVHIQIFLYVYVYKHLKVSTPKNFRMYILRIRTFFHTTIILLSHLRKLTVVSCYHLVTHPYSNFPSYPYCLYSCYFRPGPIEGLVPFLFPLNFFI